MRNILLTTSFLALVACSAPAANDTAPAAAPEVSAAEATAAPAEAPAPELGPAGTYALDPTHASLTWKISHFGLSNYTARFTKLDATLVFDPENLGASAIDVTVDPLSVETDYPADFKAGHPDSPFNTFDEEIGQDASFFDGITFPAITFKSTSATQTGPNTGTVTGDLTFRGVTKPVTLDVVYNGTVTLPWAPDAPRLGFSATGTVKRSDFGLDFMVPQLGDDVQLLIETEFSKVPDTAPADSE